MPTRAGNRDWLFKRIAWRIQALAEGDLSERARQRAEFLARDADLRTTAPRAALGGNGVGGRAAGNGAREAEPAFSLADERVPPPGTILTRVYRGQAYHVVVRDDGFEYDGQPHYMTGGKAGPLDSRPLHNRDDQAGSQAARKTWRGINMLYTDDLHFDNPYYGGGYSWGTAPGTFVLMYKPNWDSHARVWAKYPSWGLRAGDVIEAVHIQEIIDAVD